MLTQTTETAIHVLILLAQAPSGCVVTAREIGAALGAVPANLAKTIRDLVRSGLLRSFRGPSGGVALAQEPSRVSLLSVVVAVQGLHVASPCSLQGQPCAFHHATSEIHEALTAVLARWTLADLVGDPARVASCRCAPPSTAQPPVTTD